jgi:hypothetical protein
MTQANEKVAASLSVVNWVFTFIFDNSKFCLTLLRVC